MGKSMRSVWLFSTACVLRMIRATWRPCELSSSLRMHLYSTFFSRILHALTTSYEWQLLSRRHNTHQRINRRLRTSGHHTSETGGHHTADTSRHHQVVAACRTCCTQGGA